MGILWNLVTGLAIAGMLALLLPLRRGTEPMLLALGGIGGLLAGLLASTLGLAEPHHVPGLALSAFGALVLLVAVGLLGKRVA